MYLEIMTTCQSVNTTEISHGTTSFQVDTGSSDIVNSSMLLYRAQYAKIIEAGIISDFLPCSHCSAVRVLKNHSASKRACLGRSSVGQQ